MGIRALTTNASPESARGAHTPSARKFVPQAARWYIRKVLAAANEGATLGMHTACTNKVFKVIEMRAGVDVML